MSYTVLASAGFGGAVCQSSGARHDSGSPMLPVAAGRAVLEERMRSDCICMAAAWTCGVAESGNKHVQIGPRRAKVCSARDGVILLSLGLSEAWPVLVQHLTRSDCEKGSRVFNDARYLHVHRNNGILVQFIA